MPKRTKEEAAEYNKRYYEKNKDKILKYKKGHYEENKEAKKTKMAEYYVNNKEMFKEYGKNRREKRSDKYSMYAANRRARVLQATYGDSELNDLVFSEAYAAAKERTIQHGVQFHVDHIIPLKGKNVCGFHIWSNIQVIPAHENLNKSNKLLEEVL